MSALRLNLRDEISPFAAPRYARFAVKFTHGGLLIQSIQRKFYVKFTCYATFPLKF